MLRRRSLFILPLAVACLPAVAQDGNDDSPNADGPPAFAVSEAIAAQRAVRAEAEAELERLLAREAADVLEVGAPIAERGDSLNDALRKFGEETGLPLLLDRRNLEAAGIDLRDVILGDQPTVPEAVPVTVRRVLGPAARSGPGRAADGGERRRAAPRDDRRLRGRTARHPHLRRAGPGAVPVDQGGLRGAAPRRVRPAAAGRRRARRRRGRVGRRRRRRFGARESRAGGPAGSAGPGRSACRPARPGPRRSRSAPRSRRGGGSRPSPTGPPRSGRPA